MGINARIDELRRLKPGWHYGEGKAYESDKLDWLLLTLLTAKIGGAVFPCFDGQSVRIEWNATGSPSLEINLYTQTAHFHMLHPLGDIDLPHLPLTDYLWDYVREKTEQWR